MVNKIKKRKEKKRTLRFRGHERIQSTRRGRSQRTRRRSEMGKLPRESERLCFCVPQSLPNSQALPGPKRKEKEQNISIFHMIWFVWICFWFLWKTKTKQTTPSSRIKNLISSLPTPQQQQNKPPNQQSTPKHQNQQQQQQQTR